MKKLLLTFLLINISLLGLTQNQVKYSTIVKDSITDDKIPVPMQLKAGSCGSPDGSMNSTVITPPSYAWLQTNGYCNPNTYGYTPTVCWTFTPTSSSVTINSGFSYDCSNVTFSNFILYDASCTAIGTGLNFTGLTPGNTYTWCMDGNTWNTFIDDLLYGPCSGFTDFCPYFFNNTVLPIELLDFVGYNDERNNILNWTTASEVNNDYFDIERSSDGYTFERISRIKGSGNSNINLSYEYIDSNVTEELYYYRLKQVDFDGQYEYHNIISIKTKNDGNNSDAYIYPNPNNGFIKIADMDLNDIKSITIMNTVGQTVYQSNIYENGIDLLEQPRGIYYVIINTNYETITRRIFRR
jgi:hypothetical protein